MGLEPGSCAHHSGPVGMISALDPSSFSLCASHRHALLSPTPRSAQELQLRLVHAPARRCCWRRHRHVCWKITADGETAVTVTGTVSLIVALTVAVIVTVSVVVSVAVGVAVAVAAAVRCPGIGDASLRRG